MSLSECKLPIKVVIRPPDQIVVKTVKSEIKPVVTVQVPGIQGGSSAETPLEDDPLTIYLESRGNLPNGNT